MRPPGIPVAGPYSRDDEIAAIGQGLVDHSLPKSRWTHAAHFAAVLWLLDAHPLDEVRRRMPELIRAYNLATGGVNSDASGYHATITLASIGAAAAFLDQRPEGEALHASCNALLAGPMGRPDWLLAYWSKERLFSTAARRAWLAPDLCLPPFLTVRA